MVTLTHNTTMVVTTTRISCSLLHCTHTLPQHHRDTIIATTTTTVPFHSRRRKGSLRVSMAAVKEVMVVMEEEEKKKLQLGIAEFYDESSGIWENIWGDHMHHGFYDPDSTVSVSDHRAAQIRMIEKSLTFASLSGILFHCSLCTIILSYHFLMH